MYTALMALTLAGEVPVPPVNPPACGININGPILPWPRLLRPEEFPLVQVDNPTGETLFVGAVGLDSEDQPISCTELGSVPAHGTATFDVGDLTGPLGWVCSTDCTIEIGL